MIYYGNHPVPWYKIKELRYYNLIQSLYHGTASALSEGGGGEDLVTYDSYSPHIPPTPYTHIWHRCFVGVCVCLCLCADKVNRTAQGLSLTGYRGEGGPVTGSDGQAIGDSSAAAAAAADGDESNVFLSHLLSAPLSIIPLFMNGVHSQSLYIC